MSADARAALDDADAYLAGRPWAVPASDVDTRLSERGLGGRGIGSPTDANDVAGYVVRAVRLAALYRTGGQLVRLGGMARWLGVTAARDRSERR